jgi:bifunctional non-homologous end joining protein LigD
VAGGVAAAHVVRARLEAHGLESFVKTTGGKGLHLVVPIARGPSWDDCLDFSPGLAEDLVREVPEAFVAVMSKARRPDLHRLSAEPARSTSIAIYSTRAETGGAGVDAAHVGRGPPGT